MAKPQYATLRFAKYKGPGISSNICRFVIEKGVLMWYHVDVTSRLLFNERRSKLGDNNVDIKFGSYDEKIERDINKRNILNPVGRQGSQNLFREPLYSKRLMKDRDGDFALRERLLIQYGDKYYPVKKYAVDLSELSEANRQNYATADKNWYLTMRGLFREHTEQRAVLERFIPSQEVCLILTIRDPERKARIYDDVTQGLDAFNFWHSNIRIASDISVPT